MHSFPRWCCFSLLSRIPRGWLLHAFIFFLLNCVLAGAKLCSSLSPPVSLVLNASLILSLYNLLGGPPLSGMKSFLWPLPASVDTLSVDPPCALALQAPQISPVFLSLCCTDWCASPSDLLEAVPWRQGPCSMSRCVYSLVLAARWAVTVIGFYPSVQGSS